MSLKVVFVERRYPEASSIERVFNVVSQVLCDWGLDVRREKLAYGNSLKGIIANVFSRRPPAADVYHVTGQAHYYALLLPSKKTVLTIHDLQVLNARTGLRKFLIKRFFYDLPVRKVKYITVISEHVKRELITATGCEDGKLIVVDNPATVNPEEHRRPFNEKCPTILHIGTSPHKNLPNLIRALEGIRCRLTIIGRLDLDIVNMLDKCSITYENPSNISDQEILEEYRDSDIVSYCSVAEGFGLPIIEAQALSIPVVTSDLAPMNEISGQGAVLVDPYSPTSIREGILEIIHDEKTRSDIVQKGKENIRRFEPEAIAAKYRDLYLRIASEA